MYTPKRYSLSDKQQLIAFMRRFSFATIVTSVNGKSTATHIPFVIEERNEEIILTSHVARPNPQWNDFATSQTLVIFQEPHAYISPKHYENEDVPTWNYLAVHAYGNAEIIADESRAFSTLEKMIETYDTQFKEEWNSMSQKFKLNNLRGIVVFEIVVKTIEGKQKLSQNKTKNEQRAIVSTLQASDDGGEQTIAEYMKKNLHLE